MAIIYTIFRILVTFGVERKWDWGVGCHMELPFDL